MSEADDPKAPLTLDGFYRQLKELRKMGPISELLKTLPGLPKGIEGQIDERELASAEEILGAMTPEERLNPDLLIDEPRRARVAAAAGQPIAEVNSLIAQFYQARRFFSGDPPTPA